MREIDRESRVPPWRQIADHLRAEIESGVYRPDGPPVPSRALLAQAWGVASSTAHKALRALTDEGLIEPVAGMGFYVTGRAQ